MSLVMVSFSLYSLAPFFSLWFQTLPVFCPPTSHQSRLKSAKARIPSDLCGYQVLFTSLGRVITFGAT